MLHSVLLFFDNQPSGSTQPSIPAGKVNRVLACLAGVKAGHAHVCLVEEYTYYCIDSALIFVINIFINLYFYS